MKYSEISHFSHPQHKLRYEFTEFPFKCDGCKEAGIGSRFRCSTCDFDLHQHCAVPSPYSLHHPFYTKCSFQFFSRPPGDIPRYCNACGRDVAGFLYHCRDCGFDLHPCCAKLPVVIDDGEVKLYLYRKVGSPCHRCGRKGRSWSYRSTCKKYNLHVACVKDMLVENWADLCSNVNEHRYVGSRSVNIMGSDRECFGFSGGGGDDRGAGGGGGSSRRFWTRIPTLKNTVNVQRKSKGKVKKCCEVAGLGVQFIVAAVLGDPTALIAGLVGILISKG
ncbi:unnamed protein product [Linum trigynum]|uniref:Phorbol-ester/DAG-type domain-containing protein n=1 Tax=Linum trigynum TaxID=586398 RepID=A0AAV2CAQ1_9ROSI